MSNAPLKFNSDAASFAAGLRSARGLGSARQRPRHSRNGSGLPGVGSSGFSASQRNLMAGQATLALALHPDLPLLAARRASPPWRWLLCLFVILCLYVTSDVLTAKSEAFPSFSSGDAFLVAAWLSHYAGAVCFLSGGVTMLLGRIVIRATIMALFGFALAAFVVSSVLHTSRLDVSAAEMAHNGSGAMRTLAVQFGWAANLCFAVLFATLAYKAPLTGWARASTHRDELDKVHTLMAIRDAEAARMQIVEDLARMDAQQAETARIKEQQAAHTKALWDARDQAAASAAAKDPDAQNTLTLEDLAADGDDPNPSASRQAAAAGALSPSALSTVSLPLSSVGAGGIQSTVIHYTLPSQSAVGSDADHRSPAAFQTIVHPAAGSSAVKPSGSAATVASSPQRLLHPSVDGDPVMSQHRRGGSHSGAGGSADLHFFTPHGKLQTAQHEPSPLLVPPSLSPHGAGSSPSHFVIPLTPEAAGGSRVSRANDDDEE